MQSDSAFSHIQCFCIALQDDGSHHKNKKYAVMQRFFVLTARQAASMSPDVPAGICEAAAYTEIHTVIARTVHTSSYNIL